MDEPRPLPRPAWRDQPGHVRQIFRTPHAALDALNAQHGPICGLGVGPVRMAIVGDPQALRELFALPTTSFRWNHKFNVLGFVVGKQSMIVSDGDDHRRRRSSVQSAFSRRRLNGWIPMIVEETDGAIDRLVERIQHAAVVDMYPIGRALVLRIVVRSLFGERMSQRCDEIGDLFQRPQDYLESSALRQLPHPVPHTSRARVRDDRRALDVIIDAEIAHRRAHPTGNPLDILETLVADGTLSDAEIRDQVATLIGAGYDTTSASLAWMLIRATLVPGLWGRLRAEADRVLGSPIGTATPDANTLAELELANRVMRETLRLHPAGVLSPREAAVDVTVGGYHIPKGTLILWSAHLAGRDAGAWRDPLRFDPDRFVELDDDQRSLADMAWVPFGRGPRNCIGFALAQMELTLIIARLAQRLEITPVSSEVPAPVGMVVNRPSGGAPMRVAARRGGPDAAVSTADSLDPLHSSRLTPREITRHHEWEPLDDEQTRVGPATDQGPIVIVAYDPAWPEAYSLVADRVRLALGARVLDLVHVGSTAVPGLPAKPVIDIDLVVADSSDEQAYVGALEEVGFRLTIRERGWHEHRLLVADDPRTHLHVFSPDCPEVVRHRMFCDWLRTHPEDLAVYRDAKIESAADATAAGEDPMGYNLRKQPTIREIYDRMFRAHGLT